jgi:hypothetical protein
MDTLPEFATEKQRNRCVVPLGLGGGKPIVTIIVVVVLGGLVLSQGTPAGAMLDDPVEERLFEADVMAHFLALDPLVTENFGPLGQKLLIQG